MLPIRPLSVLLVALTSTPGLTASYRLDAGRTFPQFEIRDLWYTQRGRFDRARGTLEYDAERRTGHLEITIDANSLDTGNDDRDADLRGPRWFDVERHPTIAFHSQRFIFGQERLVAIEGELTMLGVTRPMRLAITRIECGTNRPGKSHCLAHASGTLLRSHFGMRTGLPFIGDEVRLRIQAEAYQDD